MDTNLNKKIIFSGIQPTGIPTLGNYIGAIASWHQLQEKFECIFFIANLHSLTVRQDPEILKERTFNIVALLLACGIDENKSLIFIQSQVKEHAELSWVLQCHTQFGELSRMTQFKDKSKKNPGNSNAGLFCYPSLMAADILLYEPDFVPVGLDQKQHMELTKTIATRFNNIYGETFKIPKPYITKFGAKIKSLANPEVKMSKSDKNKNGCITILDEPEVIIEKFKKAVTDSENSIVFDDEKKPGISNLITVYSSVSNMTVKEVEELFSNSNYKDFKMAVGEAVAKKLAPIGKKYEYLLKNKDYVAEVCNKGLERAKVIARKKLEQVYGKLGLIY